MYARGATPEMRTPARARVEALPAAMPATCVPWTEADARNGSLASLGMSPAGGNARATITLALVKRRLPFGKPGGIA